jgi:phage gp46-like protein
MTDFYLNDDFDIEFSGNGDLKSVDTIETAIPCGLFLEERETIPRGDLVRYPNIARGHFGFKAKEGCKLWTKYQSRLSTNTLNDVRRFVNSGLSFLVEDKLADNIETEVNTNENGIIIKTKIKKSNSTIERTFNL